ncbi:MAG: alpha/beta hydrolase [Thermoanaerobaculia bacterium]|nr:alpha/beta hydrolase [Thermoanaerobaculia bacterium]
MGPVSLLVHELGPRDGEPWVLVHGLGSTSLGWYPGVKRLRRECRLLVPELAATGGTSAPFDGLTVTEAVPVIADLIERRLGGGPVSVGGISLGGWVAVRLALQRPELVGALLLVAPAGYRNQDWIRVRELLAVERPADVEPLIGALFHRPRAAVRFGRRGFYRTYRSQAVRYVLDSTTGEETFGPEALRRIRVPVGMIWGERDGLFPPDVGRAMERYLERSRLTVIADCAHVVPWDCADAFCAALDRHRAWIGAERDKLEEPWRSPTT